MHVLDELTKSEKTITSMGARIREEACRVGATFSYIEPSHPDRIVVEHPDGGKEYKLLSEISSKSQFYR